MAAEDWSSVSKIYKQAINNQNATFETIVPDWHDWSADHDQNNRFVILSSDSNIVGWASLSPTSSREAYKGVAEVSIYIHHDFFRKGLGFHLLNHLISQSESIGIWTLQSSILAENNACIKLHKKAGFREVGYRYKIGKINNRWRDTILFEKRSEINI